MMLHNTSDFKQIRKTQRYNYRQLYANIANDALQWILNETDEFFINLYTEKYLSHLQRYHVNGVAGSLLPFIVTGDDEADYQDTVNSFLDGTRGM